MLIDHPPALLKTLYPSLEWTISSKKKEVFLTFDDGPTPGLTDKVLDIMSENQAKGTFFCLGKNVEDNPKLYQRILAEGHAVGNHTFNHLNGWKSKSMTYYENVKQANKVIESKLFRPPYGRIKPSQINLLKNKYRIIMWSHLSRDYDPRMTVDDCMKICLKNLSPGSILVFHDSVKAGDTLIPLLKALLKKINTLGLNASAIS
ncbi:MAG: polysaccharide deacetylase family protein [Vicingaceae bacterium]